MMYFFQNLNMCQGGCHYTTNFKIFLPKKFNSICTIAIAQLYLKIFFTPKTFFLKILQYMKLCLLKKLFTNSTLRKSEKIKGESYRGPKISKNRFWAPCISPILIFSYFMRVLLVNNFLSRPSFI